MAFQKGIKDQYGVDHPEAYWKLIGFTGSFYKKQISPIFGAFHSKVIRALEQFEPFISYSAPPTSPEEFDSYFAGKDIITQAYVYTKDKPIPPQKPREQASPSFFSDALSV